MDLYFAGTEQRMWRKLLEDNSVVHVSLNYMSLTRRRKNPLDFSIDREFDPGMAVFLDSGAATVNRHPEIDEDMATVTAGAYYRFVAANIDRIEFAAEFDALVLGRGGIEELRNEAGLPPEKIMPVWHSEWGTGALVEMAENHPRVGILPTDSKNGDLVPLLRRLAGQTKLHGVSMTSMDAMREVPWSSVATGSWLNVIQYGETFVWTGREMKWYPKREKDKARKRHRTWLADQGFDADAIEADDNAELLKLSVWSWKNFAASLNTGRPVTNSVLDPFGQNTERTTGVVDIPGEETRNAELIPSPRKKLLPVLGISTHTHTDADGNEISETRFTTPSSGLLKCDHCFVREKCPESTPGADCAFEIPAQVRTGSQLAAVQDWMIEVQTQRVAMMRLIEQLEGGYADSNLTTEMLHLARMIKAKQDVGKEGFSINIANVAAPGGPGMISRIFGQDVTDKMGALPDPVDANHVLEAEIVREIGG